MVDLGAEEGAASPRRPRYPQGQGLFTGAQMLGVGRYEPKKATTAAFYSTEAR